ncbi:MAG: ketopantoate reductase family protein [Candidatus Bathyarchaeia archaeon]
MSFNKIFALGAGAVGSSYGALLSRKNDVTLIGNKAHLNAIRSKGLTLSGDIQETFFIKAETEIKEIPTKSLILLTTKAHDSARAIKEVKDMLKEDTVILILQNGLGNKEVVKAIVGDKGEVIRGVPKIAAEFLKPGEVTFWNGETILEKTRTGRAIAALFNECGLKARISNEIDREIWTKLILNCVVNPLTAILQVRNNVILVNSLKPLRSRIMKECVEVGKCEGIEFQPNVNESIDKCIARYENYSSMCQDIMKRKETEIDFINGKIVELGRKHKIPTPINGAMTSLVKFLEERK